MDQKLFIVDGFCVLGIRTIRKLLISFGQALRWKKEVTVLMTFSQQYSSISYKRWHGTHQGLGPFDLPLQIIVFLI